MFGNLRANNIFYVLHKESTPYLEKGTVVSVSAPMPQLTQLNGIGQPTLYSVDVTVKINDNTTTFQKLPANLEVADFAGNGNIVVASSRSAMNSELQAMRQRSVDIVKSVDYHNGIIQVCDKILQDLNPEEAEKAAQQQEINTLKQQMSQMSQGMADLMRMNKELMEQLKDGKASTATVKNRKE